MARCAVRAAYSGATSFQTLPRIIIHVRVHSFGPVNAGGDIAERDGPYPYGFSGICGDVLALYYSFGPA